MRHRTLTMLLGLFAALLAVGAATAAEQRVVKYVRFQAAGKASYGILEGDQVRAIDGNLFGSWKPTDTLQKLSEVKLLVPTRPSKILAAARNYQSHAGSTPALPDPQFFFKPPSCLIAQGESIVIPKGTANVHHEGELVVVIGKRAKDVPIERALDCVLGVTCGNDVSARDWQANDTQWWRAKGSDTFGPCGPCIVSGLNYDDLLVELRVNGQVRQKERTSQMIHNVSKMVSFISRHVTLEPGDLIYTGTSGQTTAIKPGDVVEVEIEGVGILRNPVAGAR